MQQQDAIEYEPAGFEKIGDDPRSKEEIATTIVQSHPIETEEPIDTFDSPLIIESACPGWQPKFWPPEDAYQELPSHYGEGDRYSAVPCSIEEQADALVAAAEVGSAAAHVHPRDPEDCMSTSRVDVLADVFDRVYERTDIIPIQHTWKLTKPGGIDYVGPAKEKVEAGGGEPKYVEASIMLWPPGDTYPDDYTQAVIDGIEYYEEVGIKPIFKVRSSYHTRRFQRDIIDPGHVSNDEDLVVIHDMGHPFGWPMESQTWMPIEMISTIKQTQERFPEAKIGVYSGNRNWLPVTLQAVMLGVDIVRVGIEDAYWMYPHKNEVIQRNIDCIKKITDFCDLIGREVAGPTQARSILGME